jgi:hypothetical protein
MTYVPGRPHKWGLSFDINMQPGPNGRSAGSISWPGLLNCFFWLDPVKHVTGALFTQILPFYDDRVVALYGAFERGLYWRLGRAWATTSPSMTFQHMGRQTMQTSIDAREARKPTEASRLAKAAALVVGTTPAMAAGPSWTRQASVPAPRPSTRPTKAGCIAATRFGSPRSSGCPRGAKPARTASFQTSNPSRGNRLSRTPNQPEGERS